MSRPVRVLIAMSALALVASAAAPAQASTPSSAAPDAAGAASASASAPAVVSPSPDPWAADLAQLDRAVRTRHVAPFVIHSEAEWTAALAAAGDGIAAASPDEQLVRIASLVGLLDTHSAIIGPESAFHYYPMMLYRFADGWFVVSATDASLVGSRVVSVGGIPMDEVEQRLTPLVPHDNESGLLEGLEWLVTSVEYLHGTGIVADPDHAAYLLEFPDGTSRSVDPSVVPTSDWPATSAVGWLMGDEPEAVARRGERIWTRLDTERGVFLVSVNDYGDMSDASAAMTAALDSGEAERVVLDMRYLRGGSGDIRLVETMAADPRIAGPGGLTVLIGRENVSAGTSVAAFLDAKTDAVFVGEPTPARADNFLCTCWDETLTNSGYVITLPTSWGRSGDPRPAISPDVPMVLTSADFFAGRDPVLDRALDVPGPDLAGH